MKIVVLLGSPRTGGNTQTMAQSFIDGATQQGASVSVFRLSELEIAPCSACEYCKSHRDTCVKRDGMTDILRAVGEAQMVVIATPVYWWGMTAQTKLALDRLYALSPESIRGKKTLLLSAAYDDEDAFEPLLKQFAILTDYLEWDAQVICAEKMTTKGAIVGSRALESAYEAGKRSGREE